MHLRNPGRPADEDKKRKEEIETRNQADQAAYAAERLIKDAGDKLPAAERQPIENAIEELKKAIEKNDVAEIKQRLDALNAAQHKAAEVMYRTANAPGAAGPSEGPSGQAGQARETGSREAGDVIDAEVVEEEKK